MNAAVRILRDERQFLQTLIAASYAEQRAEPTVAADCERARWGMKTELGELETALQLLDPSWRTALSIQQENTPTYRLVWSERYAGADLFAVRLGSAA